MMKPGLLALVAATTIGASQVQAQSIEFGRGGPSVDLRSERQRERDFRHDDYRRDRDFDRRRAFRDRDITTGSTGCRVVTVRERDAYGNRSIRERRSCD